MDPKWLGSGPETEKTARIVFETLAALGIVDEVVAWNIFPFHPHPVGNPTVNDKLSDSRAKLHADLVYHFAPSSRRLVVAVGSKARLGLEHVGISFSHIPHPARRRTAFAEGLAALVGELDDITQ